MSDLIPAASPFIVVIVIQMGIWVVALVMLHIASRLRNVDRIEDPAKFGRQLLWFGSVVALTTIVIAVLSGNPREVGSAGIPVGIGAMGLIGGGVTSFYASFRMLSVANGEHVRSSTGVAKSLSFFSHTILLAPFIYGLGFTYYVLLMVFILLEVLLIAGKRRVDQGAVLWSLAFSSETSASTMDELSDVVPQLSRIQRGRTKRLIRLLSDGVALESALTMVPGVIPHAAMQEIQVGAQNGRMNVALKSAALRHSGRSSTNLFGIGSTSTALLYVLVVPLIAVLTTFGVMKWIIPKFKMIFLGFGAELPEVTNKLISFSDFVAQSSFGPLLILLPIVSACLLGYAYCRGWGENNIPLIGYWFRRLDLPGILRNLAATLAADRPLEATLRLMASNHRRSSVSRALHSVVRKCSNGTEIWQAMRDVGLLKASEADLLRSASRTGNLWWALQHLAESIERRQSFRGRAWLEIAQPVLVAAIGLMVAWVSIALFVPLVRLINDLT